MAALAEALADLVVEFGGERAGADAGGIGLDDAQHIADRPGPTPEPAAACARDGVGGGDEGIGAVIDVEHARPGALEQDALAGLRAGPARARPAWRRAAPSARSPSAAPAARRRRSRPGRGRAAARCGGPADVDLGRQHFAVGQIADADGAAADLVLIGRADAAAGGADLACPAKLLAGAVEIAVHRQDQRRRSRR